MSDRKKPNWAKTAPAKEEKTSDAVLRAGEAYFSLTSATEYPIQVLETEQYGTWVNGVTDPVTRARITNSVGKMRRGLFGDWKETGAGVFEMRMDFGPGCRTYYAKKGRVIIILLGGGEKSSQQKDIAEAQQLWGAMKDDVTQI